MTFPVTGVEPKAVLSNTNDELIQRAVVENPAKRGARMCSTPRLNDVDRMAEVAPPPPTRATSVSPELKKLSPDPTGKQSGHSKIALLVATGAAGAGFWVGQKVLLAVWPANPLAAAVLAPLAGFLTFSAIGIATGLAAGMDP